MMKKSFLAFDLGAESGRAILGTLADGRLGLRELHRFASAPVAIDGHLHWDVLRLLSEMKRAMSLAAGSGLVPASLAVDSWGVDFALFDEAGELIELPYSYRDGRTAGMMEKFLEVMGRERLYELTGIQLMPINTVFQLFAMVQQRSPALERAVRLRFIPDLFTFFLCGATRSEFTIATTSQLYDSRRGQWAEEIFSALGLPARMMQQVVPAGTVVGSLAAEVARETGLPGLPVVATTSHDTAAAVAAVPAQGSDWAYISSGTWSLLGIESAAPIISPQSLRFNFTNEGGMGGTFRFLKNITGLWLLQACAKAWAAGGSVPDYPELMALAEAAEPFRSLVDPDHPDFLNPPHMPEAIRIFCRKSGQPVPEGFGQFSRCILESLALKYRLVLDELNRLSPQPVRRIHIIGGGSQNRLLNQFSADACGLPVLAGPAEATAAGNILVQAMAQGHVASLAQARRIVADSFPLERYEPRRSGEWEQAYGRFQDLIRPRGGRGGEQDE